MPAKLRASSSLLVVVTAATAVAGCAREMVVAALFGTGSTVDAFAFTLAFVQTVHDLVFVGALSASVVPVLAQAQRDGHRGSDAKLVVAAAWMVGIAAVLVAAALRLSLPLVLDALAPRMSGLDRTTAMMFASTLLWLLPANALVTLFALVLTARRRFVAAALPFLGSHVLFIATAVLLAPVLGGRALAIASCAGPFALLPIMAVQLNRLGLLAFCWPDLTARTLLPFWRLSRPNLLSGGIGSSIGLLMVSHVILRGFAARHGEGAIAAASYAFRLYEVPLSLIVNPAATIVFPLLATMHSRGQRAQLADFIRRLLVWGLVILFPVAVITWVGADLVVDLLLRHGRFDAQAARTTAEALRGFAPAIVFEAGIVILFRVFYALHQPRIPVAIAVLTLASLIGLLQASSGGSLTALAMSLSGAFAVATLALTACLAVEIGPSAVLDWRALGCWVTAAAIAVVVGRSIEPDGAGRVTTIMAIAVFLAVYVVLALFLLPSCRRELRAAITGPSVVRADDASAA